MKPTSSFRRYQLHQHGPALLYLVYNNVFHVRSALCADHFYSPLQFFRHNLPGFIGGSFSCDRDDSTILSTATVAFRLRHVDDP